MAGECVGEKRNESRKSAIGYEEERGKSGDQLGCCPAEKRGLGIYAGSDLE